MSINLFLFFLSTTFISYVLDENCTDIPNCKECNDEGDCEICEDKYFLFGNSCLRCNDLFSGQEGCEGPCYSEIINNDNGIKR